MTIGRLPAAELVERLRARELSAVEVTDAVLEAIATRDPAVQAWEFVNAEGARDRAQALDRLDPTDASALPLFGVPVGVKDIFDTDDMPTTYGSPIYAGHRPVADAVCVATLRAAGAVIVGKTRTAEFACFQPTVTRNPLDLERTPGGSSSGSAAAVAAEMVPLALGAQTAGSVIRPASFCGVYGLKPTLGLLPRGGILALSETLDTVGLFSRDPRDLALALDVLTGGRLAGHAVTFDRRAPRLGLLRWGGERVEPQSQEAFDGFVATLANAGASVEELELPATLDELASAQFVIQWVETAIALAGELATDADRLSARLREDLARGQVISTEDYVAARRFAVEQRWRCQTALDGVDAILSPSTLGAPPLGLASTGDPLLCRPFTVLGIPSVAIPGAWTPDRLPVGVQLGAAAHRDARLLSVARWIATR